MYDIYNDSNELIAENLTEDQVITFANDEFAETDNIDDAIENDQLFYDNIYDAQESLEAFGFTFIKKKTLPETGDHASLLAIIGTLLISASLFVFKKDKTKA